MRLAYAAFAIAALCGAARSDGQQQGTDLTPAVQNLLERRCWDCHGSETQESGLRLDSMAAALRGGDSGEAAVVPGKPHGSYLIKLVTHADAQQRMPPEEDPLSEQEVSVLRDWIAAAPSWQAAAEQLKTQALDHWSLKPVKRPQLHSSRLRPIDELIGRRLAIAGLTPSPPADRRILIRRLYLVMHGLPPTPEQVDEFVADRREDAWPRLVEQVLNSPRYGERWGAHWLDLVRFGETHGFETNRERPNAWPYRDWVISSLNQDKPYDQFVAEQLAGDSLGEPVGTGFLVAGPYDLVKGQDPLLRLTQRQDELADMINTTGTAFLGLTLGCARCHNHKFDPVSHTDYYALQAVFAGVQHAERKLPVSAGQAEQLAAAESEIVALQRRLLPFLRAVESYQLLDDALLADGLSPGVEQLATPRGNGANPPGTAAGHAGDPGDERRMPNISGGKYTWWSNEPGRAVAAYRPYAAGRFRIWVSWGAGHATHTTDARFVLDRDGDTKTDDDRRPLAEVDQQRLAEHQGDRGPLAGKSLWSGLHLAAVETLEPGNAILLVGGETGTAITADVLVLEPLPANDDSADPADDAAPPRPALREPVSALDNIERIAPVEARFVRFTIEQSSGAAACIDELEIFSADKNVALASAGAKASSGGDFVHPLHKLEHVNDGQYGNARSWIAKQREGGWVQIELPAAARIDRIRWARDRQGKYADRLATKYRIEAALEPGQWRTIASSADRSPVAGQPRSLGYDFSLNPERAEQGRRWLDELNQQRQLRDRLRNSTSVYAGSFATPGEVRRLHRGDPTTPREPVGPGAIAALGTLAVDAQTPEAQRRLALARWIARPDNPLTTRVIVNRLWQFHFGAGIVDTPSDFGANGAAPTHPLLLDYLADEVVAHGWSLKHVHRLILHSETWRQDSRPRPDAVKADAASRLLWRFPPRRLEAEGIRDCLLAASGVLDVRLGGPGFSGFEVQMENVRHYFPKQQFGPEDWRRMIYMTKVRQEKDSVFGAFDCPDASQVVPKRSRSTTPLQALSLLNSRFVNQQAELLAARLATDAGEDPASQVARAYRLCFGREAAADEIAAARRFIDEQGIVQLCRALLNSNEFVFIP